MIGRDALYSHALSCFGERDLLVAAGNIGQWKRKKVRGVKGGIQNIRMQPVLLVRVHQRLEEPIGEESGPQGLQDGDYGREDLFLGKSGQAGSLERVVLGDKVS
jgi:hypothetical protein